MNTLPDPCELFGISAENYGVEKQDVEFLGRLIDAHSEWTNIIELGTYCGLTALFMGLMIQSRQGRLVTIDQSDCRPPRVKEHWLPNMERVTGNILEMPYNAHIAHMIQQLAPCLVIMDNGNKIQEVNSYAPLIDVGSAFCVHDFGTTSKQPDPTGEVCLDDIRDVVSKHNYKPIMHQDATEMKTRFRCWIRC